jgi:Ca-activated chloride channel family protein
MKASYALSQPIVPDGSAAALDLLISFDAETTKTERRPLSLSLVIDRSGSMAGVPLKNAVRAAQALVEQLLPTDTLSVVVYDDQVQTIFEPQLVTSKAAVSAALDHIRPGGTTNLSGGWLKGCEHALSGGSADSVRRVLLLTDGQANAGVTDPQILIKTAAQKAEAGVITTTLGFGTHFNEDLLIGMARASGGNFYFIQSYDDAADVFKIELDSLKSVAVQNLTVTLQAAPGIEIKSLLSRYRTVPNGDALSVALGDVYEGEPKLLALALSAPAQTTLGAHDLLQFSYMGDAVSDGAIVQATGAVTASYQVGTAEDAMSAAPPTNIITQITRIRIARAKDDAIELADAGKYAEAAQALRTAIADFRRQGLGESFDIAEELEQLEYFAQRLEARQFDSASRKEMRDQSYQAGARNRADLNLRGVASGSAQSLPTVSPADAADGIQVECYRQGGKLRMRAITGGYDPDFNIQFPRAVREEGVTYLVEELRLSSDGTFYHAGGTIKRVLTPGSENRYLGSATPVRSAKPAAAAPARTAADLPTTTTVGSGVLVQCVKDGSKLRARVVSDGYDPNFNMRFPRDIREEGTLYVVDEVQEVGGGGSYMTVGTIKRFVQ